MARKTRVTSVVVGMVLLTAALADSPVSADRPTLSYRVVSTDPYANTDAFHQTEVEPGMASYGSTVVAAFQMGRFDEVGATNLGFASSLDGGRTWTSGGLPGTTIYADPPGPDLYASEPSVAYDAKQGVWLIAGVGEGSDTPVFVSRSTNATEWDMPIMLHVPGLSPFEGTTVTCDNWITSPYYGNCYLKWDAQFMLYAAVSHDGGLTWHSSRLPFDSESEGGSMAVQPDGSVIMAVGDEYSDLCCTYTSHNGGASYHWYGLHFGLSWTSEPGNLRSYNFGSLATDEGGNVYLAMAGCQFRPHCRTNDVIYARGKDGWHWGPYQRVPIDPITSPADHFMAALAVEPGTSGDSAHLAITYWTYPDANCTEATCRLSVGLIQSLDGGETWGQPIHLAGPFSNTWYPLTSQGYMVGDYSAVAFVPDGVLSMFAVAKPSACQLGVNDCRVAMAVPKVPVP